MIFDYIRRVSSNPYVLRLVRALDLGGPLKKAYFALLKPKGGVVSLSFGGFLSDIVVHDFEELQVMDSFLKDGEREEKRMLGVLMDNLLSGDNALDIGANLGIHSIFMAQKVGPEGTIIAIEPESENFARLIKNIDINQLDNIRPIQVALADKEDFGGLYIKNRIGRGAISLIRDGEAEFCQNVTVLPGDEILERYGLPVPIVIKIDVEGYEFLVLKGLTRTLSHSTCRLVCCEIHAHIIPQGTEKTTIDAFMDSLGFICAVAFRRGGETHAVYRKRQDSSVRA